MNVLLLALSFLFISAAKKPDPPHISLSVQSEVQLPADQIEFNININAAADSPQAAYNLHKKREKALVQLLDTYKINEKNISYAPVSISSQEHRNGQNPADTTYTTRQHVLLTLSDTEIFEKIQIGLIKHHYDDFSANFSSSQLENGKDEALKKALQKARAKAEIIAKQTGVQLAHVHTINYQSDIHSPQPVYRLKAQSANMDSGNMLKYNQSVSVSATVHVTYNIILGSNAND